jgi:hypothetical protein
MVRLGPRPISAPVSEDGFGFISVLGTSYVEGFGQFFLILRPWVSFQFSFFFPIFLSSYFPIIYVFI